MKTGTQSPSPLLTRVRYDGVTQPALAGWLIAVALGASMFTLGASWSTCLDIGGSHAGIVSAAMNTSGQIGGILSPLRVTFL